MYIPKGRVVAFAIKIEPEIAEVIEVDVKETGAKYKNWELRKKGTLPFLPRSNFICSTAEMKPHSKADSQSKEVNPDTSSYHGLNTDSVHQ